MRKIFLFIFTIFWLTSFALDVCSRIVNEADVPLPNAIISNSNKMIVTDRLGSFCLNNVSEKEVIKIHLIGYQDQEFKAVSMPEKIILKKQVLSLSGFNFSEVKSDYFLSSNNKSVIDVDDKNSYNNVAEILAQRADMQIDGIGLAGEEQTASLSGFKPRHTLVMLDGIPLNRNGEAFDLSTIPAEIIQNIEISMSHSNKNMGPVININTKHDSKKGSISYRHVFGSFSLDKHVLSFNKSLSNWQFQLLLSKSYSRNDFKYKVPEEWNLPDKYAYRKFNDKKIYDAALGITFQNRFLIIKYKLLFQDYLKKLPGTILNPDLYKNSRQTGDVWRHFVKFLKPVKNYNLKADFSLSKENTTYDNTRLEPPYNSALYSALNTTDQSVFRTTLSTEYLQPGFYFEYGAEYKNELFTYQDEMLPANSISEKKLENYGLFGKTELKKDIYPSIWQLSGSAGWEKSNRFQDFSNWSISPEYTFQTLLDINFGGSISNGFSYPSFLSLYWKGDTQTVGNPQLEPETSLSWQIFSKLILENNFINFAYRKDKIEDMIIWFLEYNSKWKPDNIGEVEITTWEMEAELEILHFLTLNGVYCLTDARNKTKNSDLYGEKIIYTPENKLNLQAKFNHEDFSANINWSRKGKQNYTMDQQSAEQYISAYELLNANCEQQFYWSDLQFTVGIKLNNITNNMYEIYRYIPQPGFNWQLHLSILWNL